MLIGIVYLYRLIKKFNDNSNILEGIKQKSYVKYNIINFEFCFIFDNYKNTHL